MKRSFSHLNILHIEIGCMTIISRLYQISQWSHILQHRLYTFKINYLNCHNIIICSVYITSLGWHTDRIA